ncbi:MAG TPA: response regulator [Bacteroidales bacterium]|nr:response regulator [Bacteroidales bacterium]
MEKNKTGQQVRKKTVLLVEDHKYNLIVLKKMLEQIGWNVITAVNGKLAVEACMNNNNIDLVMMDLKMPVMDGYHAMVEIKKLNNDLKIIAETAYALAGDDTKILAAGFDDYLAKPISRESLENILNKHFPA